MTLLSGTERAPGESSDRNCSNVSGRSLGINNERRPSSRLAPFPTCTVLERFFRLKVFGDVSEDRN